MHTSVFLNEAVEALNVLPSKKYVDATFGEGGHAHLIAEKRGEIIGIDQDINQVKKEKNIKVYNGNFSEIKNIVTKHGWQKIDGAIFDLGLSMTQLKSGQKGLSFKNDTEILDMRLSKEGENVSQILEGMTQEELFYNLSKNSEDINSEKIAKEIVTARRRKNTDWTVLDLKSVISKATGLKGEAVNKTFARIFQALRMIVNNELENLKKGMMEAFELLEDDGILVVISFHSVEDRVVKQLFKDLKNKVKMEKVNVSKNRRLLSFERSATLRVIHKNV